MYVVARETSLPPRKLTGVGTLIPLELFAVLSISVSDELDDTEEEEDEEEEDDEEDEEVKEVPDGDSFVAAGVVVDVATADSGETK